MGASVTVSATADNGYIFDGWYAGDTLISKSSNHTFQMPNSNYSLIAKFEIKPLETYALTINHTGQGATSGSGSFEAGASVAVSATADNG